MRGLDKPPPLPSGSFTGRHHALMHFTKSLQFHKRLTTAAVIQSLTEAVVYIPPPIKIQYFDNMTHDYDFAISSPCQHISYAILPSNYLYYAFRLTEPPHSRLNILSSSSQKQARWLLSWLDDILILRAGACSRKAAMPYIKAKPHRLDDGMHD